MRCVDWCGVPGVVLYRGSCNILRQHRPAEETGVKWMNMNRTTLGLTNTKLGFGVGGVPREEQGCS